jgi:hypothetical protein
MILYRAFFLSVAFAFAPHISFAAEGKNPALKSATKPDADFFLQGEYTGSLAMTDGVCRQTGLQVIALGGGKFRGVEYAGGLPGSGWDGTTRKVCTGRVIAADVAELTGEGRRLTVRRSQVVVKDSFGKTLGKLEKTLRMSQTLRASPPEGARVLFSGHDARDFDRGEVTPDHLLVAGADTKRPFGDFTMHLEFRTPYMPQARDQGRGNSGVYIQGRYEVQILDSFGLEGEKNECGSLYRQRAPLVNMSFPPLAWQTYDIDFTAPRFDSAGKKTNSARITLWHNGIVVQNNVEITDKTGAGAAEGPNPRPIKLQDHGNPVHFRNIWIAERKGTADRCECPMPTLIGYIKSNLPASGGRSSPGGSDLSGRAGARATQVLP